MSERNPQGQSGGINISGSVGSVGGDMVGGNKTIGAPSTATLDDTLRLVLDAIQDAPDQPRAEAEAKLTALKHEAAKGDKANDGVMAKLIDGMVGLVPAAATAVVSAFATPILAGVAGPMTKFVLDKVRGT